MKPFVATVALLCSAALTAQAETKLILGKQTLSMPLEPIRVTVPEGERVVITFPVLSGNLWLKDNQILPGQDGRSLVIPGAHTRDAGTYRVMYTSIQPIDSQELILKVAPAAGTAAADPHFLTFSARGIAGAGNQALVTGFVVSEAAGDTTATKKTLIRAVGPSLAEFGVTGALSAPRLAVYDRDGKLCTPLAVDAIDLLRAQESSGAYPIKPGAGDAVQLYQLSPGAYTAQVTCVAGAIPGTVLLEVYDVP